MGKNAMMILFWYRVGMIKNLTCVHGVDLICCLIASLPCVHIHDDELQHSGETAFDAISRREIIKDPPAVNA